MAKTSRSKNVGEWSEVYALAYLLGNGGGYGADENQDRVTSLFYKVLSAMFKKQADGSDLTYKVTGKKIEIFFGKSFQTAVSQSEVKALATLLHDDLLRKHVGRAFSLKSGDDVLRALLKESASAPSSTYNDIYLSLEDVRTKAPSPFVGFSIKSQLNAKSTLLNATGATNFVYEIVPNRRPPSLAIPKFGHHLKPDMQELVRRGYKLKFSRIDSETHQMNMQLVDSHLPEYMAQCLFETTQHSNNRFDRIAETVFPPTSRENKAILLKLKQYLGYVMLGMTPTKEWSGQPGDFGGMIIVKKSGDVLFYYLYNMEDFQEFLFRNLKFEYGSRARHKFGKPYGESGKTFIKLNLQLRFA